MMVTHPRRLTQARARRSSGSSGRASCWVTALGPAMVSISAHRLDHLEADADQSDRPPTLDPVEQ